MATRDIGARLQHPRRSLGNRHRSQAEKFLNWVESNSTNLHWAEQSARQAVLHDFTHPDKWRILLQTKVAASDADGIRSILDELFLILGRDPELLLQLDGLNMLEQGSDLLEAAIIVERRAGVAVVPRDAVTERAGRSVVFVIDGQRAVRRIVSLGLGAADPGAGREGCTPGGRAARSRRRHRGGACR